jgi:peptidoglycan/xylan/chitin deacetylase (PgdA/CDA1 family)
MNERIWFERIRLVAAYCFYYTGVVDFMFWLQRQCSVQPLTILCYHEAVGENLRRQLLFLKRHYRLMHLEDALEELYAAPSSSKSLAKQCDKRPPMVITFDDGYLNNYTYAFRLARELQIPYTLFLIPDYVERGTYFWWLADDYLADHAQVEKVVVEGQVYHLDRPAERKALAKIIDRRTRHVATVAERESFLAEIQQALETPLPDRQSAGMSDDTLPVNWEEVLEMDRSGWVSIGAHTMHHPLLTYLTDPEELRREVQECREVLEQRLGHPVRTFCYPAGKFGEQSVQAVKAAGYTWAVTTIDEVNTPAIDPFLLRRKPGVVETHWLIQAAELAGLLAIGTRLKRMYGRFFKK